MISYIHKSIQEPGVLDWKISEELVGLTPHLFQLTPVCILFRKGKVSFYREGLNYSFCDRERPVLVLKVSFLSEKLL